MKKLALALISSWLLTAGCVYSPYPDSYYYPDYYYYPYGGSYSVNFGAYYPYGYYYPSHGYYYPWGHRQYYVPYRRR